MRSHWTGIALVGGMVLLLSGTPAAWGQIAAPSIAPGSFSGENPAAIKWGAPSRIGLGAVGRKQNYDPKTETTDSAGGVVGLRLVGESFAFGVDYVHVEDQESTLKNIEETGSAALALQTGSSIAWGLGYTAYKLQTDQYEQENKEPTFGISLRLAEVWFIGAVVGRETMNQTALDPSVTPMSGERDTFRYGLGFRRGGTVLVHAEIFGFSKDDYETKSIGKTLGEQGSGGTLEFTFWSFLIGGSARHASVKNIFVDTVDTTTADIGWAPRQGLAITLHYEKQLVTFEDLGPGAPETSTQETGAMLFTWQF